MDLILLGLSFGPMLLTAFCLYQWFLKPRLDEVQPAAAMQVLMSIHCFRFISPISLVAGVTLIERQIDRDLWVCCQIGQGRRRERATA